MADLSHLAGAGFEPAASDMGVAVDLVAGLEPAALGCAGLAAHAQGEDAPAGGEDEPGAELADDRGANVG